MKPRRWIVVFGVLAILVLGGMLLAIRALERSRKIEQTLVTHLSPLVGGSFEVQRVRIGFFSVYLSNVQISIPLRAFDLRIRDIKVGISFRKLLRTRFDLGRSITKIILLNPEIGIGLEDTHASVGDADISSSPGGMPSMPMEDLLIRNGLVRVRVGRSSQVMAERLDGRLWEADNGLAFEMRGTLGARRRNLSVNGVLADDGSRHRVSLRLDRARIAKPITWRRFVVSAGTLDGVCEILFGDRLAAGSVESTGWIAIRDGRAGFEGAEALLRDFDMSLRMVDSMVVIDSMSTRWNDLEVRGEGEWNLARRGEGRLALSCAGIDPAALFPDMAPVLKENLLGKGRVSVAITRTVGSDAYTARIAARGFSVWGDAITRARARTTLKGDKLVVDTLFVGGARTVLRGRGSIDLGSSPPAYHLRARLDTDAGLAVPDMRGRLGWQGTLRGAGERGRLEGVLTGDSLRFHGFDLGCPRLAVVGDRHSLSLETTEGDGLSLSGRIDKLFTGPVLDLDASLKGEPVLALFRDLPWGLGDSLTAASMRVGVEGPVISYSAIGHIRIHGPKLDGGLILRAGRIPGEEELVRWDLSDSALTLHGVAVPIAARGYLTEGRLDIEELSALEGISGGGNVYTREPVKLSLDLACGDVSLGSVDGWLLGGGGLLRGGTLGGSVRLRGELAEPSTRLELRIREADIGGYHPLHTDMVIAGSGYDVTARPFVVRKGKAIILAVDTVSVGDTVRCSGSFKGVDIAHLLGGVIPEDLEMTGTLNGEFRTGGAGFPVEVNGFAPRVDVGARGLDSVAFRARVDSMGVEIEKLRALDGSRVRITGEGVVPWAFWRGEERETDTLRGALHVRGDLLASFQNSMDGPIGGTGEGEIEIAFTATSEEWHFSRAYADIPHGALTLYPFVQDTIEEFRFRMEMDEAARVHTHIQGAVRDKPITISSSHEIPEGYEPIELGPVSLGVLQVRTPQRGIALHLPGFMEPEVRGEVEFASRKPFDAFTLSGPVERLRISGTWVLRDVEFTFPFLDEEVLPWDWDPYPYVTWEMDLVVGNRQVVYFYDVALKRRFLRAFECHLEPGSKVRVRGRMEDNTFRLLGSVRANRGEVFYGKVFDRNFEAGCDFEPVRLADGGGYDNLPIIWGSVEALSDTSRFDRVKLTLMVRDSATGALSSKGRFRDIEFRLSSRFEEIPGESERAFYRAAGLRFSSLEGAGGFVSDFGEQYLHRYLLQRFERRLAKRLGLDVISVETSIASNYFYYLYHRRLDDLGNQWDNLAFGNVGITVGRYFFRDKLFLKWRTELVPTDTLLHPEHSIGLEYQPFRFLLFEAGTELYRGESAVDVNPSVRMRLRVPLKRSR